MERKGRSRAKRLQTALVAWIALALAAGVTGAVRRTEPAPEHVASVAPAPQAVARPISTTAPSVALPPRAAPTTTAPPTVTTTTGRPRTPTRAPAAPGPGPAHRDDLVTSVPGQPYVVQGTVTDDIGNPIAGVCVTPRPDELPRTVTGPGGFYRLEFPPGTRGSFFVDYIDCTSSAPGYVPNATVIPNITEGDTSTYDMLIYRGATLTGTVVNEAGQPVSGACVTARTPHLTHSGGEYYGDPGGVTFAESQVGPTGADGRFAVARLMPIFAVVTVEACGAGDDAGATVYPEIPYGGTGDVTITVGWG